MKIFKSIIKVIVGLVVLYFLVFVFWLLLGTACVENNEPEVCRDNVMSDIMSKTHKPIIWTLNK